MRGTIAPKPPERCGGRFIERPLTIAAEPVMNAQAVLDDVRKYNARQARIERAAAAERDRINHSITCVLVALTAAIATGERKC